MMIESDFARAQGLPVATLSQFGHTARCRFKGSRKSMRTADRGQHVIVVGAGIVGAALAYELTRRGIRVTLVDAGQPGGGVTHRSFAWINVSYGFPHDYLDLRRMALADWRRLEGEFRGRLRVDWSGALTWHADLARTERFALESAALGHDVKLVTRSRIAELEPSLLNLPDCAAYAANEGSIDAVEASMLLTRAARESGASVHLASNVLALTVNGNRVNGIMTAAGRIDADLVVLAAGVGTKGLMLPLGIDLPLEASPSILLRWRTRRRLVKRVVSTPYMEVRPSSNSVMIGAENYGDASGESGPEAIARRTTAEIGKQIGGAKNISLIDVGVGIRPFPGDRLPIVGRAAGIDGVYVSVMHAGVTLAPLMARLAAAEIAGDKDEPLLGAYRLDRFRPGGCADARPEVTADT